jgi:hypothetical protein
MVSGTSETTEAPERTPGAPHKGIWTVALTPEFGVGMMRSLYATISIFACVTIVTGASILLAVVLNAVTGIEEEDSFFALLFGVLGLIALTLGFGLYRSARRWTSLSTPEGVRRAIEKYGDEWPDSAHDRAAGAVRSAWKPFRRARWEQLPAAARAFDLPPPRALVIDPTERFKSLPREFSPDLLEPEDVGRHAFGKGARSRALSVGAIFSLLAFCLFLTPMFFGGGFRFRPDLMLSIAIVIVIWLYGIFSPARSRWIPGVADSIIAAPSLVVVRSLRTTTVFTPADSLLVLSRERQSVRDSRVVITRDDGKRVTLRFAGPEDERLQTLWTMWNHPRACRWDSDAGQIMPERESRTKARIRSSGNGRF